MTRQRAEGSPRRRREAGVATVWALAWAFVCLTVGWVALVLAMATARQHQVDGAADLASLSAAGRLQRGGDACRTAAQVAAADHVLLLDCRVERNDVVVTVRARVDLPFGLHPWVSARARAGPP